MTDRKITGLDALTGSGVDVDSDLLEIVDASETNPVRKNKRIVPKELIANSAALVQAGSGAVSTTGQEVYRREINSLDFMSAAQKADVLSGAGLVSCTTAVQNAINAAAALGVGVTNPPGRILIDDTLTFPLIGTIQYLAHFSGAGHSGIAAVQAGTALGGTVFVTPALFAKPLFKPASSRGLVFRDFNVVGPAKGQASSIAFHFNVLNSEARLDNIWIDGFQTAFQNGNSTGTQGNDDQIKFFNVNVRNVTYVVRTYNSQAFIWNFFGCGFENTCDTFLKAEAAGGYQGARCQVFGGFMGVKTSVIDVTGTFGHAVFNGVHFENAQTSGDSITLFDDGGSGTTAPQALSVTDCYFNYFACSATTTAKFIRMGGSGPLSFKGNKVEIPNPRIVLGAANLGSGGLGSANTAIFDGNNWRWEPKITRPDTGLECQYRMNAETFVFYNKSDAQGTDVLHHSGYIPSRFGKGNGPSSTEYWSDALPTAGTYNAGDRIRKFTVAAAASPGWVNTANGTFSAATDSAGDTDGSTAVITGLADTSDFIVGEYVTASAGFPSTVVPYRITALTSSTMTLDTNSNSAQVNITVATVDPVFKAEAAVAA